jgi:hypothetical protein
MCFRKINFILIVKVDQRGKESKIDIQGSPFSKAILIFMGGVSHA